jgi:hypothetical protein
VPIASSQPSFFVRIYEEASAFWLQPITQAEGGMLCFNFAPSPLDEAGM